MTCKRLYLLSNPFEDPRETKFMTLHPAVDECVAFRPCDLDIRAISTQEDIGGGEGDTLIAIKKAVIIPERFHQGRCFLLDEVIVSGLRTKNGGLKSTLVADSMETAEHFNQPVLHRIDFSHRKVVRHLLRETLEQVAVLGNRLLESIHHFAPNQVLRRNHIMQIEPQSLLENMPLGLPILLGNRNEFIVELSVNLRSEFLGGGRDSTFDYDLVLHLKPL